MKGCFEAIQKLIQNKACLQKEKRSGKCSAKRLAKINRDLQAMDEALTALKNLTDKYLELIDVPQDKELLIRAYYKDESWEKISSILSNKDYIPTPDTVRSKVTRIFKKY